MILKTWKKISIFHDLPTAVERVRLDIAQRIALPINFKIGPVDFTLGQVLALEAALEESQRYSSILAELSDEFNK